VHVLRRTVRPRRIVGVEADEAVLAAARAAFPLAGRDLRVVAGDARRFLATTRSRFDLVVDDVYEMAGRSATRKAAGDVAWWRALVARVAPGGVLAVNFLDEASFAEALPGLLRALPPQSRAFRFDFDAWHNVVFASTPLSGDAGRHESALRGAVPDREARARGFHLTALRVPGGGGRARRAKGR
jgi:spermidine synthase